MANSDVSDAARNLAEAIFGKPGGTPRVVVSGTAQGRLALVLVNTWRRGAGLKPVNWGALDQETQDAWWSAAHDLLRTVLDVDRLVSLADDLEATLDDLSAEDTTALPAAFKALLN